MKPVIQELIWVAISISAACLFFFLAFGLDQITVQEVSVPLHDTYYVLSSYLVLFSFFAGISYLTSLTRIISGKSRNTPTFIHLIIANILLLILLISFNNTFSILSYEFGLGSAGWTVYPPFDAVPTEQDQAAMNPFTFISNFVWLAILILIGSLTTLGIMTGKRK